MEEYFDTALKTCGDEKECDEKVDDDDYFGSDSKDKGSESGGRLAELKDTMSRFKRGIAELQVQKDQLHRLQQECKMI